MKTTGALLFSGLVWLIASPALSQAASAETGATAISWDRWPTTEPDDYPAMAVLLGLSASMHLRCIGEVDGSVSNCEIIEGAPYGWGFEAAAVQVVQRGRVNPRLVNGVAEPATFTVRIPFLMADLDPVAPYSGPEPAAEDLAVYRDVIAYTAGPEYLFCLDIDELTPEQRAAIMPLLRQVFEEHRTEWVEAMGLALARSSPPGAAQALRDGRAPPGPTQDALSDAGAFDRVAAVETRIFARVRILYCARFDCSTF